MDLLVGSLGGLSKLFTERHNSPQNVCEIALDEIDTLLDDSFKVRTWKDGERQSVFGPPVSGSKNHNYVLWLLFDFLSLKNDVNVPSKRSIISGSGSASGSESGIWIHTKCHESATLEKSRVEVVVVIYFCPFCCVVVPDSHEFWSVEFRAQEGKIEPQKQEKWRNFMFFYAGFRFNLSVFYGGLGISILHLKKIKNRYKKNSAGKFYTFLLLKYWILIRICN